MKGTVLVLRHVPHEGLGTLGPALRSSNISFRYLDIARGRPTLPSVSNLNGLIVMGGPMGVYEKRRYPFLHREIAFIKKVIAARKPALGICLGAQLIAHALKAAVHPNPRKEIGWFSLHRTPAGRSDPLFRHFRKVETVFQWHGDTFDLPRGAALLATSPLCRNQAFRFRDNVVGLQFHVEVDATLVREWLSQPGADREIAATGPGARRAVIKNLPARARALKTLARPIFREMAGLFKTASGAFGPRVE